jgi:hypothetical protein
MKIIKIYYFLFNFDDFDSKIIYSKLLFINKTTYLENSSKEEEFEFQSAKINLEVLLTATRIPKIRI